VLQAVSATIEERARNDPQGGRLSPLPEGDWHRMPAADAMAALHTSRTGLTSAEARRRLLAHGPNTLPEGRRRTPLRMFAGQFTDFMILVLLVAAVVSGLIGDLHDAATIVAILVLNAAVGFVQEYRAERAMEALKAMAAPTATVLREGSTQTIAASDLVAGDVVLLDAGDVVPADLRLLDAAHLEIDEATLTGESVPPEKTATALSDGTLALGDRTNMAYKATTITNGRGVGIVVATGMATEFGKIAHRLAQTPEGRTPLQRRLAQVGRRLAIAALAICAVVFVAGIWRGEPPLLMFLTAVSLAVAAIPEALPAVVTVSLALGARKMVEKHALVRKLPAVETLGSVTYICSDKTGTLTMNRMCAEAFYCDGVLTTTPRAGEPWHALLRAMALSNDARAARDGATLGDPTEVALLVAARDAGIDKGTLEGEYPRVAEIPFDAARRCMTTVHRDPSGGFISFTKGAPELMLAKSTSVLTAAGPAALRMGEVGSAGERMAADGHRVLALAMRRWPTRPASIAPETVERDLTLLGLVGIMDPPRLEAGAAVATCRAAGIVPVMITGDHPVTARAIAARVGIIDGDEQILTGADLGRLSADELTARVERVRVYARVAPEQKLDVVRALQRRGEIVAMTGDGVNDAPALRQADIGIAMGIAGTDVTKEASAMVLLDDDFATIVRAVREGRVIYDNLRRFIKFAVTTNSAEVWLIFLAPFLGLPMPLLPIQILWINLVTDGLPGLALAAEPEERDVMHRPPRPPDESMFARGLGIHAVWVGVLMAALSIATEAWATRIAMVGWQTLVFTVLCFSQLGHVLAIRSERASLFTQGLLSNRPLLASVVLTAGLLLATIYAPALNGAFKTHPLSAIQLAAAVGISSVTFWAVEVEKWVKRRRHLANALTTPVEGARA
jgi:Ca2+-transporting ATPase